MEQSYRLTFAMWYRLWCKIKTSRSRGLEGAALLAIASFACVQPLLAQTNNSLILSNDKGVLTYQLNSNTSGGAKLVDGKGMELASLNRKDEAKRRVLEVGGRQQAAIFSKHSGKWEISDGRNVVYVFKQEENGYKLKTTDETTVYRIKSRPYGLEVEDSSDQSLYKVRVEEGKVRMKDAKGNVVFNAAATADPLMISCFGLDKLSLSQKAGLALAVVTMR